jgi:hypothetical protein
LTYVGAALRKANGDIGQVTTAAVRRDAIRFATELRTLKSKWHLGKPELVSTANGLFAFRFQGVSRNEFGTFRNRVALGLSVRWEDERWVIWEVVIIPTQDRIKHTAHP